MEHVEQGRVKWFNAPKGYGFIESKEGKDVFVHYSAIKMEGFRTLEEGQPVVYNLIQGPKGLMADYVAPA